MKDIGKGIAVAGIWIGVGISSAFAGQAIIMVALFAAAATVFGLFLWDDD